jgi:hypothetical protein
MRPLDRSQPRVEAFTTVRRSFAITVERFRRPGLGVPCLLLALVLAALAAPALAQAQTFTVTNTENSGTGSLRAAVEAANGALGADTIGFAAGVTGAIHLSGTGLSIKESVAIEGPGAGQVTVEQTSKGHRVFKVDELAAPGAVKLSGLHVAGGRAEGGNDVDNNDSKATLTIEGCLLTNGKDEGSGDGGAISSEGAPLIVRDSTFAENEAVSGGAILAGGDHGETATIEGSTFTGNVSEQVAGAVLVEVQEPGLSQIAGSAFAGNRTEGRGGAVYLFTGDGASARIANSTFTANQSKEEGGALDLEGEGLSQTVEDSTIAGNHVIGAGKEGGGIEQSAVQRLVDTIVAGNSAAGGSPDFHGKALASFDLIGNPAGAELTELAPGSDLLGVDPQLSPLANNGGSTQTMALAPTSPAVNKGGGTLASDQRGDTRPIDYPDVAFSAAVGANGADIGAYELSSPPVAPTAKARHLIRFRIRCPKGARPGGCRFAVQAVTARPRRVKGKLHPPKPESAVARVKLGPGKSALLILTPKPKFAARLEAVTKLLVREVETAGGRTHTSYRRLKVVG